jgi:uncharacterized membrane protein
MKFEVLTKVTVKITIFWGLTPCNLVDTVKPVLNGISKLQNIFPLKPGFPLIKVYYDSPGT